MKDQAGRVQSWQGAPVRSLAEALPKDPACSGVMAAVLPSAGGTSSLCLLVCDSLPVVEGCLAGCTDGGTLLALRREQRPDLRGIPPNAVQDTCSLLPRAALPVMSNLGANSRLLGTLCWDRIMDIRCAQGPAAAVLQMPLPSPQH